MGTLQIVEELLETGSGAGVETPAGTVLVEAHVPGVEPLPVYVIEPVTRSWEEILVSAGLDRESRELSAAERSLVDERSGSLRCHPSRPSQS